jgi:hypothetical protein
MPPLLWIFPLAAMAAAGATAAPAAKPESLTIQGRSGQFTVIGPRASVPSPGYLNAPQRTNFVLVDPPRLAVTCERIKQALLKELQAADAWKGHITLNIYRAGDLGEPIFVKAQYLPAGWDYQVSVPGEVEASRLLRVLVAVLLQEMADRKAGARPAELPPWLARGLAAQLETLGGKTFILEGQSGAPHLQGTGVGGVFIMEGPGSLPRIERHVDPLAEMRRRLGNDLPLSVDELNWPTEAQLASGPLGYYETSAQLFVVHLLRLAGGPECLRGMLDQAPQHLNWQTAFLGAFARHFKTLRDADKWWTLQIASFTGRDPSKTYTLQESWQKLEDILACPVSLPDEGGKTAQRGVVTLQTVIGQWDYARQKPMLRQKLNQLQTLRLRISPQLLRLTDDYRDTLAGYLNRRDKAGFAPEVRGIAVGDTPRLLARKTVERLDALDGIRADLKRAGGGPPGTP